MGKELDDREYDKGVYFWILEIFQKLTRGWKLGDSFVEMSKWFWTF